MSVSRRTILGGGTVVTMATSMLTARVAAQISTQDEFVELWPGPPPNSDGTTIVRKVADQAHDAVHPDRWVTGVARPVLVVRRAARPNGAAMLVLPGGGYSFLSYDNEGTSQAAWLNARGITAFILLYRLPGEGWNDRAQVPLQDAQRAMRFILGRAAGFGIRVDRIGVLGFSAGSHLAGSLATRHAEGVYVPVDAYDQESARPDIAALIYPMISIEASYTHGGSRDMLLSLRASEAARRLGSVGRRVDRDTPPTFLVHATDDGLVPPANSIAMFAAMTKSYRPVALHIFEDGGHGFGTRLPKDRSAIAWSSLFTTFAARHGLPE